MRHLSLTTLAVLAGIAIAAQPATAARTMRTSEAPVATSQTAAPQLAWGFGFYTCINTMYRYGQRTYGGRVSDNILFQAAYETCASAY
jgi:hypothetical protein